MEFDSYMKFLLLHHSLEDLYRICGTGRIPQALSKLGKLRKLGLRSNNLEGEYFESPSCSEGRQYQASGFSHLGCRRASSIFHLPPCQ